MGKDYILVIDEGTTGVRAFIYNKEMKVVGESYQTIQVFYPGPNEVEEDAQEIYDKTIEVCRDVVKKASIDPKEIECVGITNQRMSWVLWNKETGVPLHNAIIWLDQRGLHQRQKWIDDPVFNEKFPGIAPIIPGSFMPLVFDKIRDQDIEFKIEAAKPTTTYGGIDTWLIWKLTGGKVHATTGSSASATSIYDTDMGVWNMPIMDYVGLSSVNLPQILEESDDYGKMTADILGVEIPICSAIADQQAALFSQGCINKKTVKCTNGTGTFVDINVGTEMKRVGDLLPFIAWKLGGETKYLLEGFSGTAGACLEWAKTGLCLFDDFSKMEEMSNSVEDNGGVYFVPALSGLVGAPYKDETSKGAYMGITGAATKNHFVRATLEALAFAAASLMDIAKKENIEIETVKLSGGVSKSDTIGQIIANVVGAEVIRPESVEASALGAAELAAIKSGWFTVADVECMLKPERTFSPNENQERDRKNYEKWLNVVSRTLKWNN